MTASPTFENLNDRIRRIAGEVVAEHVGHSRVRSSTGEVGIQTLDANCRAIDALRARPNENRPFSGLVGFLAAAARRRGKSAPSQRGSEHG